MRIEKDMLWTGGVMVGILLVFTLVSWWPHHREVTRACALMAEAATQLEAQNRKAVGLVQLASEVKTLKKQLLQADKHLQSKAHLGKLLKQLSDALDRQGVWEQSIQTQAQRQEADYLIMPLSLHFKGTFEAMFVFLKHIEQFATPIHLNHLAIRRSDRSDEKLLDVQLEMNAFFLPEGSADS